MIAPFYQTKNDRAGVCPTQYVERFRQITNSVQARMDDAMTYDLHAADAAGTDDKAAALMKVTPRQPPWLNSTAVRTRPYGVDTKRTCAAFPETTSNSTVVVLPAAALGNLPVRLLASPGIRRTA